MIDKSIVDSKGINSSEGINWSEGINFSKGINSSFGVFNSHGIDRAIFTANKTGKFTLFDKEVTEERWREIWDTLHNKLNGWYPKFNNAFELYLKVGNDWKLVDASKIKSKLEDCEKPYEAWKDMPVEAQEYLMSLPEFNAEIFFAVTGINLQKQEVDPKGKEIEDKLDGKTYKAIIQ